MKYKILIVDDEKSLLVSMKNILEDEGYEVFSAENGTKAIDLCNNMEFDLGIIDVRLPDIPGDRVCEHLLQVQPNTKIIVVTAYGNIDHAIKMIKNGAFYYLTKPYDIEELKILVKRALDVRDMETTIRRYSGGMESDNYFGIVGKTPAMKKIFSMIEIVSENPLNILITGETGTGKEVTAKIIHNKSLRKQESFITVNCAAIPDTLIDSELFGYKKGAFTGAITDKKGKIELANNGTLFLDEIGELPLQSQSRLLRVLKDKKIERLGSVEKQDIDFRLICSTNRNLEKMVRDGTFRKDLYFRINVFHIHIPPLRERREDIPLLIRYFIKTVSKEINREQPILTPDAMKILLTHNYEGNVRELKNIIEHAVALSDKTIGPEHLPAYLKNRELYTNSSMDFRADKKLGEIIAECEKKTISETLSNCGNAIGKTAKTLGISRKTLWQKIKKYGIK